VDQLLQQLSSKSDQPLFTPSVYTLLYSGNST